MIEETVKKIEAAIAHAHTADPKNKAELVALLNQLKGELQQAKRSHILKAVDEDLREAAIEFESSHPTLAAVVGEVSTLLASIGI